MIKQLLFSLSSAAIIALSAGSYAAAQSDNDAAMTAALETLDASLPGKLINNPYDIQWRTDGSDVAVLQRNVEPYDSIFEEGMDIEKEWKLYNVAGKASRDYSAEKTNMAFNLAKAKQTIEFGQFYVMNLGPNGDASKYIKN